MNLEGRVRILVVDDNPVNCLCTAHALGNRKNSSVTTVSSGFEALEEWNQADVILMDVHMPPPDGLETTKRIRKKSAELADLPNSPVIIGYSTDSNQEASCKEAGMDDFMTKPMTKKDLNTQIDQWEILIRQGKTSNKMKGFM